MSEWGLLRLLFWRFTWRHWLRGPGQALLLVTILALGVTVYFSIRLANRAVLSSFERFTAVLSRETDLVISAPAGGLAEAVLPELREALGGRPVEMIPVLETTASRPLGDSAKNGVGGESFRLVGVDLLAIQNLREDDFDATKEQVEWGWAVEKSRGLFVSRALGVAVGTMIPLVIDDQIISLEVVALIPERINEPQVPASLMMMDLPALQALLGREGQVDRVELLVASGVEREGRRSEMEKIVERVGRGRWLMEKGSDRRESGATMTRAFRLNLTVLSLIALGVGLYLIFQALDGAVLRRRQEIAVILSLGVEGKTIWRAWLVESLVVGLLGGVLGGVMGWGVAQLAVRFVGRTVDALYFANSADAAGFEWREFGWVVILSVVASVVAGWIPARTASQTPPAQMLGRSVVVGGGARWLRSGLVAVILLGIGGLSAGLPVWRFPSGFRLALGGYVAAGVWIFAGGMISGHLLGWIGRGMRPLGKYFPMARLAASQMVRPSGRHWLAAGSLSCAVAMTAGMAILVGSFERTMERWIETTFQADLYISTNGAQNASTRNRLREATWKKLSEDPAVMAANVMHSAEVTFALGTATVLGVDFQFSREQGSISWLGGAPVVWPEAGLGVFVSEAYRERFRLGKGSFLLLPTPAGEKRLPIMGVYADYGAERGTVLIDRDRYLEWFGDRGARSVILKLRDGGSAEGLRQRWVREFPGLQILTTAHLRTEVLRIFRQTFSITYALEAIGVVVAVLGLGLTLMSILLDRQADLTTLRALGVTRLGMALSTALEGGAVALSGMIAGLAVSLLLGWLLIEVINKQTFGWTLLMSLPVASLGLLAVLVLVAGWVAAMLVGMWGGGLPADRGE